MIELGLAVATTIVLAAMWAALASLLWEWVWEFVGSRFIRTFLHAVIVLLTVPAVILSVLSGGVVLFGLPS